jgi:hypothetical protein
LPNYVYVPEEVGSNDGLNVIIQTYPQWRQHLRPNATKSFVIVTDDDATDGPNDSAATFRANLTALDPMMFAKSDVRAWLALRRPQQPDEDRRLPRDVPRSSSGWSEREGRRLVRM